MGYKLAIYELTSYDMMSYDLMCITIRSQRGLKN